MIVWGLCFAAEDTGKEKDGTIDIVSNRLLITYNIKSTTTTTTTTITTTTTTTAPGIYVTFES